ncbi:type II toxin-antitoxin system RelE/ParE family toxin [Dietzia cinnamea]|uniref:type II toxin-antitoxin system RelE/ParE family toxin n=1 Tax=Dietzia cinnamea TaxID=321318 RepID=UPI00223B87B7|nr:type II toxin-antitoxin system RelE/ParE family toxin [Dietzia cinnamea]MCT1639194.1 type II toxin-antitoxin system RelE/ParE family toxin [Dietzia cinnamea]MCT2173251.1 type II toxin-antitoxin system RelE/ParE family toxin [Dietzia cinnamea]
MRDVEFIGSSLDDLRSFPKDARDECGHGIYLVQQGEMPKSFKSMSQVGSGCYELRVQENDSWFRVFYVATLGETVWILHAFQKKSNQTSKRDIDIGKSRFKEAKTRAKEEK